MKFFGDVTQAIETYTKVGSDRCAETLPVRRPGTGELRFSRFSCDRQCYACTDAIRIEAEVAKLNSLPRYFISFLVNNRHGLPILHIDSRLLNMDFSGSEECGPISFLITNHRLAQGDYTINAFICCEGGVVDHIENCASFNIEPKLPYPSSRSDCASLAVVYPEIAIEVRDKELQDAPRETARV